MKKSLQDRLSASLDKALAPPRQRPKQNLDALLDEYDDGQPAITPPLKTEGIPPSIPSTIPTGIPVSIPSAIPDTKSMSKERQSPRPAKQQKQVEEPEQPSVEPTAPLDATHTAAERSVYSIMYRETISKGASERHFGPAELMKKTGIRSRNTVHKALYGLIEKLSVEVVSEARGNPLGPRYRVFRPQAIEQRRKSVGVKIDTQTKRIVERGGIPTGIPASTPTAITRNWDTTSPETGIPGIPNFGRVLNTKEDISHAESDTASSSSKSSALSDSDDDAAFLDSIREIYEKATGNEWTTADAITAQKGRDISAAIWGTAICHCIDRAPNHRFDRLAYVLKEAREHAEAMKDYSESDLRVILRHSLRLIERARATGRWTLAEIEATEGTVKE
jgi:hypothetical protein